jgi:hypothetical protein
MGHKGGGKVTLKPVDRPSNDRMARRLVQVAGFVFYLLSIQALMTAGVGAQIFFSGGSVQDLLLPSMSGILACCYALVGFHLRRYRLSARNFAFAFAGIGLFAFPIGTGLGLVIVGCIAGANRARVFPLRRGQAVGEEEWPLLRFEPELAPEQAG